MERITIRLSKEVNDQLQALRSKGSESGKFTYNQLISYLLIKQNPESYKASKGLLRGTMKVEDKLLDWLHLGHDVAITPTEIQSGTGSNFNICKKVFEAYKTEIEEFNKRFKS